MIVYEVNCIYTQKISDQFNEWLPGHIQALLTIDGFISADICQILKDDRLSSDENSAGISVRYFLKDQTALDNYLTNDAERLRQDGKNRFGDQLLTYRRILLP